MEKKLLKYVITRKDPDTDLFECSFFKDENSIYYCIMHEFYSADGSLNPKEPIGEWLRAYMLEETAIFNGISREPSYITSDLVYVLADFSNKGFSLNPAMTSEIDLASPNFPLVDDTLRIKKAEVLLED